MRHQVALGERMGAVPAKIESVGVVGGGFMGAGIAETVALAGIPVVVRDLDEALVARTRERLEESLERAVARGKAEAGDRDAALERIQFTDSLEALAGADLVVEAVPEDLSVKEQVVREIDALVSEDTLIASNTSSIPIAQLAAVVHGRERVLGLHFFAPVPVMGLVEIVRGLDTSEEAVRPAREFAERIGKQPIETKDRSGFIVNMLLVPYLMAAVRMYEEGFATREDIDAGMRLGCGHPMGPLALCDLVGLDVLYAVCDSLFEEFKRDEYAPPPLLKRMLASDRLGRKSGRGFYDYSEGASG